MNDLDLEVDRSVIDRWIAENNPDGLLKLAQKCRLSSSTITKARLGVAPKKLCTRRDLARGLEVPEGVVFYAAGTRKKSVG